MIRYESQPQSPVITVTVSGRITNDELLAAFDQFRRDLEIGGKSRVLEIIEGFSGLEPKALWNDLRLGIPLARKISHVAVVADQAWIRTASHLGAHFTSAELRVFDPSQRDQAKAWIEDATPQHDAS